MSYLYLCCPLASECTPISTPLLLHERVAERRCGSADELYLFWEAFLLSIRCHGRAIRKARATTLEWSSRGVLGDVGAGLDLCTLPGSRGTELENHRIKSIRTHAQKGACLRKLPSNFVQAGSSYLPGSSWAAGCQNWTCMIVARRCLLLSLLGRQGPGQSFMSFMTASCLHHVCTSHG